MDHATVVRQKMTERYLLDELDPQVRDEFEEHYFDCQECALDVKAGAVFIEQSKAALAEQKETAPALQTVPGGRALAGLPPWMRWFRPATVIPVLAILLAAILYQGLVEVPKMQQALNAPQVLPWAQVNIGTYGGEDKIVTTRPGQGFLLFVRIPPDGVYARYTAELYDPAGKREWSVAIPVTAAQGAPQQDQWPVQVPPANRQSGTYSLVVSGVTGAGEVRKVGQSTFEIHVEKQAQ